MGSLQSPQFTPDGRTMIAAQPLLTREPTSEFWSWRIGSRQWERSPRILQWVREFATDGRRFVIRKSHRTGLGLYDGLAWEQVRETDFDPGDCRLLLAPDGNSVFGLSPEGDEPLWQWLFEKNKVRPLKGHREGAVTDLAFTADGKAVSVADDGRARLWDPATSRSLGGERFEVGPLTAVACSPLGRACAAGSADGRIVVWDAATG